jgi:bifunctional non-homologous end joining protein LigD
MSLVEYRRKRRFDRTPEPEPDLDVVPDAAPGAAASREPPPADARAIFVVQLHHARSRHYDFRLQVGDALKSWAVPKGPSLDPKVKRLAAEVEDHPLAYASFEGDIPEGQYGAGHVDIFDSGVWRSDGDIPAQLEKGHLEFELFGGKLKGGWHLVRTRGSTRQPQWLLFKRRDEFAQEKTEADDLLDVTQDRRSPAPDSAPPAVQKDAAPPAAQKSAAPPAAPKSAAPPAVPKAAAPTAAQSARVPAAAKTSAWRAAAKALDGARAAALQPEAINLQLARLVEEPPAGDDWIHEPKWDGYRILALIRKGEVTLWSRNRLEWTRKLPGITAALRELGLREAALDGELIAGRGTQKDFGLLQATLSGEKRGALNYMLFDLLHLDGVDLAGVALVERKRLLETLLSKAAAPIVYSAHVVGNGPQVFEAAAGQGLEGIISKRADAPHRDGRSDDWRKIKELTSDEFAVVGFTPPKGSRTGLGALLLARPDPQHGWRYTGRLGTGFSNSQLGELLQRLDRNTQAKPTVHVPPHDTDLRAARWIEPALVVEAFYRGVGKEGLLRQPSLKTIRVDKDVQDLLDSDRGDPTAPGTPSAHDKESGNMSANSSVTKRVSSRSSATAKSSLSESASNSDVASSSKSPADIRLTHPERVVFPDRGTTKGDIADYYIAVMPWLLPEIINRPLSIIRCTQGIEKACFFQKHATAGLSKVDTVPILEESGKYADYLVVRNAESLMELVQFNAIEFHPWGSTAERPDTADRVVFDLDPAPGVAWKEVTLAARQVRDLLQELSLTSYLRTSGGKGLHVVVPLNPGCDWSVVKPFARAVAEVLAAREPRRYVSTASKAVREGRIFIDYLRNGRGATSVASWSLRSRSGAPVAVPLTWDELEQIDSASAFDIDSAPQRIASLAADPWAGIDEVQQDLSAVNESLTTEAAQAEQASQAAA